MTNYFSLFATPLRGCWRLLSLPGILLVFFAVSGVAAPDATAQAIKQRGVSTISYEAHLFSPEILPDVVTFCDKKVSLSNVDIRERFERELFQFIEHKGLMTILVKRYYKYLGMMKEEFRNASMPDDLMYLVITESYLDPRAVSSASAAGLWQFIQETGRREGLSINDQVDERYNMIKSTRSALAHLKKLYTEFGDWFLAMAAYNSGPQRVRDAIANQNTNEFFDMYLPRETERYIYRVMALKEIITNREKYGIFVSDKSLYKPVAINEVFIELQRDVHTNILSKCMDVPYRVFREYNLHLRKYKLAAGIYHINIPSEKRDIFANRLKQYEYIRILKTW